MKIREFLKKPNAAALLICVVGIAVNIILNGIVVSLGLPLYLDTVGTVAVAIMGGYLPGVAVGFATNLIKSMSDPASMYYGVLNELIAISATYLARRGWFKKAPHILGTVAVFVLIGGGLGSIIPWCMQGLTFDSESLSGILYDTGIFGDAASHIFSSIIMDIPDKAITVLFAAVIVRAVPARLYAYCGFALWQQKPDYETLENAKGKKHAGIRVISMRTKTLLVLVTSITVIAVTGMAISMRVHHENIMNERAEFAQSMVRLAADVIDGDRVNEFLEKGGDADGYAETRHTLAKILSSSTEILYLYAYKIQEDGCHVVFDMDVDGLAGDEIGTVIEFDEGFSEYIPALLAGEAIDPIVTNDKYGYLLTAYQPIYDSHGNCVCYVGADVDLVKMAIEETSFLMKLVSMHSGFLILLCVFVLWLVDYHIVIPVRAITDNVDAFALMEGSQKDMDQNVRKIRSLAVHTGDELESLYLSLCRMTANSTEQMRSIRRLSDSTAKMQDGMIITMADLVESRDADTGGHVQRTAAYVKIIVNSLKKKGYYPEKITPKFMSDVVRSAPLHDIGKINIPDKVLNKPGKLTDEEYAVMKSHTTAGKRILENAIISVEGDSYLKEARNMAAYHHERWDGKGYPEGIHGEVIPLSARIMAVADVFDALTASRVYKPGFPIEKALSILEEGKGQQFDPKCVEAFMDALPEVKVVLKKYNKEI